MPVHANRPRRTRRPPNAPRAVRVALAASALTLTLALASTALLLYMGGGTAQDEGGPGAPLPLGEENAPLGSHGGFLIDTASARPGIPFEAFDAVTMAAFDLDGNGVKEILAHNDNNRLYIFDGATGTLLSELETRHPDPWGARELAGPAVGDLTGNGLVDVVVTNSAGWVTAFEVQPYEEGRPFEVVRLWEQHLDPQKQDPDYVRNMYYGVWEGHPGLDGPAYLADAAGDGRQEIFVQLDDMPSLYKLGSDGGVVWWANYSDGNAGPVVGDLTGDGRLEVVYPSDGGQLHILDARTMSYRCLFDARPHGVWPGSISVSPTLADLTGDGRLELAFGVRNVAKDAWPATDGEPGAHWVGRSHAHYFAITADCEVLWQQSWVWGNPHVFMMPVPVDLTGDGVQDLVFQDWNTIGHPPGGWAQTGRANLFAVHGATGSLLWQVETDTYWSNKNLAVADVTGDGEPEILVNLDHHGRDGIGLYSLQGTWRGFVAAPERWQVSSGPLVSDLDGDGRLQIVLPVHRDAGFCTRSLDVGCREGAIVVYRTESYATPLYSNNHLLNAGLDPEVGLPGRDTPFEPESASAGGGE